MIVAGAGLGRGETTIVSSNSAEGSSSGSGVGAVGFSSRVSVSALRCWVLLRSLRFMGLLWDGDWVCVGSLLLVLDMVVEIRNE